MSEKEFQIGNLNFQLNKIDPFVQLHIIKRLAPVASELIPAVQKVQKSKKKNSNEDDWEALAKVFSPILMGFSKLSDEDTDYVLFKLLSSAEMQQSGNWMRVASDNLLMVQNLELPTLIQIATKAFKFNLTSFIAALQVK